jgi:hypothetical protein
MGVPGIGMLLATVVPMALVILVKDMAGLADLYAVGVVGAIATNLGATATDWKLSIKKWERTLMFGTFIVMAAIETSLLIDKPNALYFAVTILAVGLILRGLVQERRMKKDAAPSAKPVTFPIRVRNRGQNSRAPSPFFAPFAAPAARWTSPCVNHAKPGVGFIFSSCASNAS